MRFRLVWFDSMGAKSSCVYVSAKGVKIIIDPGVAIMHPSFPGDDWDKLTWLEEGRKNILKYLRRAEIVVISHYHYDHYIHDDVSVYLNKTLFVKNPNIFINDSQYKRALRFFSEIYENILGGELEKDMVKHEKFEFGNPMDELPIANNLDLGDYNDRRREVLENGFNWFQNRVRAWNSRKLIPEISSDKIRVYFAEGKIFEIRGVRIKFSKPMFHGIEFSRVGWVFMTEISDGKKKLLHTSDLNGPIIEDYAEEIIRADPDILIIDGPMTYMLGYTMNLINLKRTIKNLKRIVAETKANPIILDHHLPREKKFRERLKDVYKTAEDEGKEVLTAAEFYGEEPIVLRV